MSEFAKFIRNRGAVKHKLTNFIKFFNGIKEPYDKENVISEVSFFELQDRFDKISMLLNEFEEVQINVEYLCDDNDLEKQYEVRGEFTDLYSSICAQAKLLLKKMRSDMGGNVASDNEYKHNQSPNSSIKSESTRVTEQTQPPKVQGAIQGVKLPTINLTKFDGKYNNWMEFKDTFNSLIHLNDSINNIQKFHYLRASLENDALKVIQSLEFSSENYATAWELLCNRYNNNRLLVHNHIKSIFEMDILTRENAAGLRNLIDNVFKHLRALETLKQPVKHWDTLLIFVITTKLDKYTAREWEKYKVKQEFPKLEDLSSFLKARADWLETLEINHPSKVTKDHKDVRGGVKHMSLLVSNPICNFCTKNHLIYQCDEFLKLDVSDRYKKVSELKLCNNCLCKGHVSKACKSGSCKKCKFKHNTLLHKDEQKDEQKHNSENISQVSLTSQLYNGQVLLSTALVLVKDAAGKMFTARALLDCGSQSNFISMKLFKKLHIQSSPANISIVGINKVTSSLSTKCDISIQSLNCNYSVNVQCFVLPAITDNIPLFKIDVSKWNLPKDVQLADPHFNEPGEIDVLLGAGLFWDILTRHQIKLGNSKPTLQHTLFGWIISGTMQNQCESKTYCNFAKVNGSYSDSDLHSQLQKFWEIEEIPEVLISQDDVDCETHFVNNFTRDITGRFVVKIPFKHSPLNLGDSKTLAIKRLYQLEKKFEVNSDLKVQYHQFMKEYIDMGHMSLLQDIDYSKLSYFLPHHGVVRQDSVTTKLRVVFDGSAPSDSGWSLNDLQYTGPTIQNDVLSILLRFRQHSIVVCADVAKMYRQVLVHPSNRQFQMILWRFDSNKDISIYSLNTVTYGTRSAPYLAIRCIKQLAIDNEKQFPNSSKIISRDFYVDDLITGFDSEQIAIETCTEVSSILNSAGFPLRKWISNNKFVLSQFQNDNDPVCVLNLENDEHCKTLGIRWYSNSDVLSYHINSLPKHSIISKRTILSEIAKIFDPLGLVSPCIVLSKIILQKLWTLKLNWNDPVPDDIQKMWLEFRNNLNYLNKLEIDRHVICKNAISMELHGFCDASKDAYAAAIYLRSGDNENIYVNLLCAKTKVAPLKSITIPRLELCGALLLSELINKVKSSLTIDIPYFLWSDSQIVLCWIATQPNHLQTFVQNRVGKIQNLTDISQWRYIRSKDNPADLASRGISPKSFINSHLWFHGPPWMTLPTSQWPINSFSKSEVELPELKRHVFTTIVEENDLFPFNKFSSLTKLKNTMAYCLRFIANCRTVKENREIGQLTVTEINKSTICLVKLSQKQNFNDEIQLLQANHGLKSKHKLLSLAPFLDSDGLLRVGGRLNHSQLPFSAKHPLLLSGKHILSKLIFENVHKALLHAGPQLLLATVRQTYWVTSGMSIAKKVTRNCIQCFKFKPKTHNPIMAHLPKDRVTCMHPFYITGVDYAGPFLLKDRKGRGSKELKSYICLFICFTTKAMHLELVTDLTTECFLSALRRFTSRRGKPSCIYSDNATNFVGAVKQLNLLHDFLSNANGEIARSCASENISWHFIPPNSPTFGGLWESGVKSVKHHLLKVVNNTKFTYEEFQTIMIQVEAILNSRPIHPLSSDPNDLQPLTPSHFLLGRPLVAVPDHDVRDVPVNRLSRFQLLQQITQSFWSRWSKHYLSSLQERQKWKQSSTNLPLDSLVLIKHDNLPPCNWLLGRVISLHPGDDKVVRVASVKTKNGVLKRAVNKLCPLPLPEREESSCFLCSCSPHEIFPCDSFVEHSSLFKAGSMLVNSERATEEEEKDSRF